VSGQFDEIVVRGGWPTALRGTLDMDGLIAPPRATRRSQLPHRDFRIRRPA